MNVLSAVITEAFGVALVGYVASLALAQGSAKKYKYSVDDNQVEYTPAPLPSCCIMVLFTQILRMLNLRKMSLS